MSMNLSVYVGPYVVAYGTRKGNERELLVLATENCTQFQTSNLAEMFRGISTIQTANHSQFQHLPCSWKLRR